MDDRDLPAGGLPGATDAPGDEDDPAARLRMMDADAEALVVLMLDVLAPVIAFWSVEAAQRTGLDAPALACVQLARKHGRVTGPLVMERTGLTRSAVSKLARRLEAQGHVELIGGRVSCRALEIGWRPSEARDVELAALRAEVLMRVRYGILPAVAARTPLPALRLLREIADCVHAATRESVDRRAEERRIEARRRRRAEEGW